MEASNQPLLISSRASARAALSAPVVAAIALMVVNDHWLKGAGLLPGLVTGKLSDFAFLFFAPIVLAFATRARSTGWLLGCYAAPAALFVTINLSPEASAWFAATMSRLVPMRLWPDPTDLVALASLPPSWWMLTATRPPQKQRRGKATLAHTLVTAIAAISCLATSPPQVPQQVTHRPIYMSWEEFRSTAVKVMPPQPIGKRGKLLIVDQYLLLSEPGKGVHVFDNSDRTRPVALLFIRIPGNIDIAVRDDLLYADSFVDLLTFRLDLERAKVQLIARLEDQFAHNPYQSLTEGQQAYYGPPDDSRGIVVRLEPIDGTQPEQAR